MIPLTPPKVTQALIHWLEISVNKHVFDKRNSLGGGVSTTISQSNSSQFFSLKSQELKVKTTGLCPVDGNGAEAQQNLTGSEP